MAAETNIMRGIEMSTGALISSTTDAISQDKTATLTIKQILAQLDGSFPMDEAVINGECSCN